jgi:Protein of unknown function (DUF3303)
MPATSESNQTHSISPFCDPLAMLFMVVERFVSGRAPEIYRRAGAGRLLPPGLTYVDSWVRADLRGCFQLMECDDPLLLQEWVARWEDLTKFTIVPVTPSSDTADLMQRLAEVPVEDEAP